MTTLTPPNHDTFTCYVRYRCRRPECVTRYNTRHQERIRAQKQGIWNAFIDAEPSRQHILRLQAAGFTVTSIATAAQVDPRTIFDFVRPRPTQGIGRRQRTSPDTAAKILAVTPTSITARIIDATGTKRRAQALIAIGWPKRRISQHAGVGNAYLSQLFDRPTVYATRADAITRVYNELRDKRPTRYGVDKCRADRARDLGAANRWPKPSYWDRLSDRALIDDPTFIPEATRAERIAYDAAWLLDAGHTTDDIAKRLGISRGYVERALREHPQDLYGAAA